MQKLSLDAVGREQLRAAGSSTSARAATTVVGGHERALRQTVVALLADAALDEHENPGEASLQVLSGRVELRAGSDTWEGRSGDLIEIPKARNSVHALEDSVVLLTAVPSAHLH
ncbi:MAG TPA: cupin domain-containing protein [Jatrophihabitans sp.]|nr:cupin domain-containing protein [Jatrophihabitans sp.]